MNTLQGLNFRIRYVNAMRYTKSLVQGCLLVLLLATATMAQITEKAEFGKFAITNATIHTVTNGVIEHGVVLIEGENIVYVGKNAKITSEYVHIDAAGKHVYPGFIDAATQLGLSEIGAVAVTRDQAELGEFTPEMRAFTAVNPNSVSIPVTRINGVTNVISMPVSGLISGKATLLDLYGYTPDSMAVQDNAALHLKWPSASKRSSWDRRDEKKIKKQYEEKLEKLNKYWDKAQFYDEMITSFEENSQNKEQPDISREMRAMREAVTGEIPVIITVSRKKDILNALEWVEKYSEAHFILAGVQEGWRVADKIAEAGLPCIVSTLYTPTRKYDNYKRPYQNPGLLHEAGVELAITADNNVENVRNLLYNAGYAAAYGLGKEEALKAVTINTAEIFGVDDLLGSIEEGKQANLFIADGDPFEPATHIKQVFIRGHKIPMVSRQTQLYEEYLDRGSESAQKGENQ